MKPLPCLIALIATFVLHPASLTLAAPEGLHAGAAATNIDPPKFPVIQNGGFAQRLANAVQQSLHARSLVLRNGETTIAICVVDTCMMDREFCDRAKAAVTAKTGIPANRILLSATHTHTAPSVMRCLGCPPDPEYPGFLLPKIVESIADALTNLQPAEAGATVADADDFTNTRRWIFLPHSIGTDPYGAQTIRAMMHPGHANPNTAGPSGPEDPDLTLLSLRTRDGKPLAVLGNLSQHYFADGTLSSGYTGKFCTLLEEEFGDSFVALMSQGTSGDLQHKDYGLPADAQLYGRQNGGYERYCRDLADLALDALKVVDHHSDSTLAMAQAHLPLGRRLPDAERLAWAKPIVEELGERLPRGRPEVLAKEAFWIRANPSEELVLQALRIGDFAIATLPNEVYGITGLKLKLQSPLRPLMNIELANGGAGYIPPPEQHHLGGYTTWPARTAGLEVQAEPKIVDTLLGLLEDVSGKPRRNPSDTIGVHGRAILDLKPAAWYRMSAHSGNRIPDASGHKNHGRLDAGYALFLPGPESETLASTERGNRAVHFAGGRLVARQPAPAGDYSVSLWFWNAMPPNKRNVAGYFLSLGDKSPAHGDHLGVAGSALKKSQGKLLLYNGNQAKDTVLGKTTLELQRWYHLLLTRSGDRVRVHLDGQLEIDAELPDTRPENARFILAARSDGFAPFEGKLDEAALFPRALSTEEIATLHSSTTLKIASASASTKPGTLNPEPGTAAHSTSSGQAPPKMDQTARRAEASREGGSRLPNVLFIGVDDLRPELNCYGATHIHSPNIDRLAAEGVLFERAYCQWAVCMPSRASLLSGLRPDTFQGRAHAFRELVPGVITLPQHFKNHGYFTQSFGKIYHGSWKTAYVGNKFQDPVSWSEERWAASPQYYFSPEGIAAAREVFAASKDNFLSNVQKDPNNPDQWKDHFVRGPATEAPDVPDGVPADGTIATAALERLRALHSTPSTGSGQAPSQPFFLAVGFQKPHLPFVAPKKYWDLYDPEKLPGVTVPDPPVDAPEFAVKVGAAEVNQYLEPTRGRIPPARTRHLRHGYAACVSYVDAQIGLLLDELDRLGIRDNTIVVLWSDHGYKLGDLGSWAKHTNFELDTRVPLIVSAPNHPRGENSESRRSLGEDGGRFLNAGKRSSALVELVDLHPTLAELAGLPVHPGAEGESFAVNVRDPNAPGQGAAYSQFPRGGHMGYTVRTATHRYTEWRNPRVNNDDNDNNNKRVAARELYEYGPDGIERTNLADHPDHAEIQERLRGLLSP